jgi:hypothetical protein
VNTAYLVVTAATIGATGGIGLAAAARARFVLNFMAEVGVPESWVPRLAALKVAGAVGLLVGFWLQPVQIAAAAALILYFIGAVITHVRARVMNNVAFPATYLGLAIASLWLAIAR